LILLFLFVLDYALGVSNSFEFMWRKQWDSKYN
jgi:hypothetical protein